MQKKEPVLTDLTGILPYNWDQQVFDHNRYYTIVAQGPPTLKNTAYEAMVQKIRLLFDNKLMEIKATSRDWNTFTVYVRK